MNPNVPSIDLTETSTETPETSLDNLKYNLDGINIPRIEELFIKSSKEEQVNFCSNIDNVLVNELANKGIDYVKLCRKFGYEPVIKPVIGPVVESIEPVFRKEDVIKPVVGPVTRPIGK